MVGGKIIEIETQRLPSGMDVLRLWVLDTPSDECAVHVDPSKAFDTPGAKPRYGAPGLPALGENIWWQSGRVYFDNDRRYLVKVGNSFDPRVS
jgi:hypothetical protein